MEIGMNWIIAIIIGVLVIYAVSVGVFQKFVPVADEAADVKLTIFTSELVKSCRDWAGNIMLDSTMPSGLVTAAINPDIPEEDRWEFCETCYDSVPKARLPCRQCKAACVKLMIDESGCRANAGKFPETFKYDLKSHKAEIDGESVDMNYNTAYTYCTAARIGDVKGRVEAEVT